MRRTRFLRLTKIYITSIYNFPTVKAAGAIKCRRVVSITHSFGSKLYAIVSTESIVPDCNLL